MAATMFFTFTLGRRGGHAVEVCEDPERVLARARSVPVLLATAHAR